MKISCACGIFIGFILASAASAYLYYHFHLRNDSELSAKGMQQIEEKWNQAKNSGDKVIETIKPYAVPDEQQPAADTAAGQEQ